MSLRLDIAERGGDRVVQTDKLCVSVGERMLVRNATVTAARGDVVALVGPNGAGKTTLLATLLGDRAPASGSVRIGASIWPAWYRQDLAGVPLGGTIYEVIQDLRPLWTRGQIQGHLGAFGFSGDEVQRATSTLSGGERARVALAMITLSRANLLVLDEPTNHLDVESIEALEDAIEEYEGTVILVSHDRAFLRELATHVWSIEGGALRDFRGPFVDWEADVERRARAASEAAAVEAARVRTAAQLAQRRAPAGDAGRRNAQRAVESAEHEVTAAEVRVQELESALADPALYDGTGDGARRAGDITRELHAARAAHDAALAAWAEALERLEHVRG
jgi:ATP-binding cassette subfamily F protein 3